MSLRIEPLRNSTSFAVSDALSGEFLQPRFRDEAHALLFIEAVATVPDSISDMQVFQATDKFLTSWEEVNLGVMPTAKELAALFLASPEFKALLPKEVPA